MSHSSKDTSASRTSWAQDGDTPGKPPQQKRRNSTHSFAFWLFILLVTRGPASFIVIVKVYVLPADLGFLRVVSSWSGEHPMCSW